MWKHKRDRPGPILGISFLGDDVTGGGGGVWLTSSGGRLREKEDEEEIRRSAPFTPDKRPSGKNWRQNFSSNSKSCYIGPSTGPKHSGSLFRIPSIDILFPIEHTWAAHQYFCHLLFNIACKCMHTFSDAGEIRVR